MYKQLLYSATQRSYSNAIVFVIVIVYLHYYNITFVIEETK